MATHQNQRIPNANVLAYQDREVIGKCALLCYESSKPPHKHGLWLIDLFVRPEFRGLGVARQLVNAARSATSYSGYRHIHLLAASQLDSFYQKLDWTLYKRVYLRGQLHSIFEATRLAPHPDTISPHGVRHAGKSPYFSFTVSIIFP